MSKRTVKQVLGDCQYRHDWANGKCNTCGAIDGPASGEVSKPRKLPNEDTHNMYNCPKCGAECNDGEPCKSCGWASGEVSKQCAACRAAGPDARCSACPRNPWEEHATSDDGVREYEMSAGEVSKQAAETLAEPVTKFQELLRTLAERAMSVTHHDAAAHEEGYIHEVQEMERLFRSVLAKYPSALREKLSAAESRLSDVSEQCGDAEQRCHVLVYGVAELREQLAVIRGERCSEEFYGVGDGSCGQCVKCLKAKLAEVTAERDALSLDSALLSAPIVRRTAQSEARCVALQATNKELVEALEKFRDYPHGTDNCCAMGAIADALLAKLPKGST